MNTTNQRSTSFLGKTKMGEPLTWIHNNRLLKLLVATAHLIFHRPEKSVSQKYSIISCATYGCNHTGVNNIHTPLFLGRYDVGPRKREAGRITRPQMPTTPAFIAVSLLKSMALCNVVFVVFFFFLFLLLFC